MLAAMDAGTVFDGARHASVMKSAIALHFARKNAAQVIHARVWADTVERGGRRWLTEHRQLLALEYLRAVSARDPFSSFMGYYHALEYNLHEFWFTELREKVKAAGASLARPAGGVHSYSPITLRVPQI